MKTKAIASVLAAFALLLLALFLNPASGKPETANIHPAAPENKAGDLPVKHVGMGENQPL